MCLFHRLNAVFQSTLAVSAVMSFEQFLNEIAMQDVDLL